MELPVVEKGTLLWFFRYFFSFVFLIVCFSGFSVGGWAGYTILLLVFFYSLIFFLNLLKFPSPQTVLLDGLFFLSFCFFAE